jgi:hypothetical protein
MTQDMGGQATGQAGFLPVGADHFPKPLAGDHGPDVFKKPVPVLILSPRRDDWAIGDAKLPPVRWSFL